MSDGSSNKEYAFSPGFRFCVGMPTYYFGLSVWFGGILQGFGCNLTKSLQDFNINAEMVNKFARTIEAHTVNQNFLYGFIFTTVGVLITEAKKSSEQNKPN